VDWWQSAWRFNPPSAARVEKAFSAVDEFPGTAFAFRIVSLKNGHRSWYRPPSALQRQKPLKIGFRGISGSFEFRLLQHLPSTDVKTGPYPRVANGPVDLDRARG
jgi:hypothetical protein